MVQDLGPGPETPPSKESDINAAVSLRRSKSVPAEPRKKYRLEVVIPKLRKKRSISAIGKDVNAAFRELQSGKKETTSSKISPAKLKPLTSLRPAMSMPTILHDSGISGSGPINMTKPTTQQSTTGEAVVPERQCNDPNSQTTGTRKRRKSFSQSQVAQTSQLTANIANYSKSSMNYNPFSLTNQGKQIDSVDADNEEYPGSMSAPGASKRPRFATYAFTTSPPLSAAVLTLSPVDPVRLPSSPSHPQEDLNEPLSTGEYGADVDFQSLGDESMQNVSTHVDFEMLDLADVTALPWVDNNPDFSSDLHAHSSLYMQQASIFVPAGLGVMLQNMKHELEMEIMARQRAERWFLDELQRRVEAERSLASLREEGH